MRRPLPTGSTAICEASITTTRNEDVDEINRRIQRERLTHGELGRDRYADISTGVAFVGDVVVTRRNDRTLRSADGDHVKNRERWTIESISANGSIVLAVGDRRVDVPAHYVNEHIQLGYATTEYGAQGMTVDESITLVTDATTHRAVSVGATRGRNRNALFVVAPDQPAALERLQVALTLDRAGTPAIRQWSQLVEKVLGPHAAPRTPVVGIEHPSVGLP